MTELTCSASSIDVHRRSLGITFFPEFDPFTAWRRVVVPVQFWVIRKNLNPASNQQKHAKQIDEMIRPKPQRKRSVHIIPLSGPTKPDCRLTIMVQNIRRGGLAMPWGRWSDLCRP